MGGRKAGADHPPRLFFSLSSVDSRECPFDARTVSYNRGMAMPVSRLPGADLIETGVADLTRSVESVAALLVAIGAPRLRALGLSVPATPPDPEHRLYLLLARDDADSAHSRYNALIRRLVSFERALSCVS